jgi:tRNA A37 threonylcarbamoyltransferase TsaD
MSFDACIYFFYANRKSRYSVKSKQISSYEMRQFCTCCQDNGVMLAYNGEAECNKQTMYTT